MSTWQRFVHRTLLDLRNGARIPEYFGCLISILAQNQSPPLIESFCPKHEMHQRKSEDDFISLDVVQPKQKASPVKPKPDENAAVWFQSSRNASQAPPPAIHESDSSESTPQSPQKASTDPEPESESVQNKNETIEEEEVYEEPAEKTRYTEQFKSIGDRVVGQFWYPIETEIPRLVLESKLMTTFKPSKFGRLRLVMLDARKSKTANRIMFSRRQEEEEEVEDEEDDYD